jgi:hypothetical protein
MEHNNRRYRPYRQDVVLVGPAFLDQKFAAYLAFHRSMVNSVDQVPGYP